MAFCSETGSYAHSIKLRYSARVGEEYRRYILCAWKLKETRWNCLISIDMFIYGSGGDMQLAIFHAPIDTMTIQIDVQCALAVS